MSVTKVLVISGILSSHFYDLSALFGCGGLLTIFNVYPFYYTAVVVSGKVERS